MGKLIQEGNPEIKMEMEELLQAKEFHTFFDEQIMFSQLNQGDDAIWSLLLASGYLKVQYAEFNPEKGKMEYILKLTNREVHFMFQQIIEGWFNKCRRIHNAFLKALISNDLDGMNI